MNSGRTLLLVLVVLPGMALGVTLPPGAKPEKTAGRGAAVKPPDPQELPALVSKLSAADSWEREEATRALIAAGAAARPLLWKALESADPEARWRARYALAAIEDMLDRPARDPARELFSAAARAQAAEPKRAAELFRELLERFPGTRWALAAGERLAELEARQAAPAPRPQEMPDAESLIRKLGSPRWAERQEATIRLAAEGEAARPALEKAADSPDAEVAWRARRLLDRLSARPAPQAPEPERPQSPGVVIELLGEQGRRISAATSVLDTLVGSLSEDDASEVARARAALLALGPEALDPLIRALDDADEATGVEIMDLLGRITGRRLGFRKARWLAWWRKLQEGGGG